MKPFMETARAHQKHQHLLIGNACALIHGVQAVQKTVDFSLIEVRNRGKNRPARTGALHERKESLLDGRPTENYVGILWLFVLTSVLTWPVRLGGYRKTFTSDISGITSWL